MTDRELLQQALNALLISAPLGHAVEDYEYRHRLIKDIEAELAKPEQEPVGYFYLRKSVFFHIYEPHNADPEVFPLYTAPPRKPWVGLTSEELAQLTIDNIGYPTRLTAALEAKLKEKNT